MKKELKDYLHFYLGCNVSVRGQIEKLIAVARNGDIETFFRGHLRNYYNINDDFGVKPILRSLSNMTEEEKAFINQFEADYSRLTMNDSLKVDAEIISFLLSKKIDLFGLIESGLAVTDVELQTVQK